MWVQRLQAPKLGKVVVRRGGELGVASARSNVDTAVGQHHGAVPRDQRKRVEDVGQMPAGESGDGCSFGANSPRREITDHAHRRCAGGSVAPRSMQWSEGQAERQNRCGNQTQTHISSILYDWYMT